MINRDKKTYVNGPLTDKTDTKEENLQQNINYSLEFGFYKYLKDVNSDLGLLVSSGNFNASMININ